MTNPDPSPADTKNDRWTVSRILEWTSGHFSDLGFESSRLEAELLLAHVRSCARIELYTRYSEILGNDERSRMRELVKRRAKHEPVAYLTGSREFFSLNFDVSKAVLIPRPETEFLVEETLKRFSEKERPKILDLGTGSGCIAVTIAVNLPSAQVVAIDLSNEALEIARRNAKKHNVVHQIRFLQGDLFAPLEVNERFDVIVSNPPYVCDRELAELDPDVRDHEPRLALIAGEDGLDVVRRIVDSASGYLAQNGLLLFEIDSRQSDTVRTLCAENDVWTSCDVLQDLAKRDRVVVVRK